MKNIENRLKKLENKQDLEGFVLFVDDDNNVSSFAYEEHEIENLDNLSNEEFFAVCDATMGKRPGFTQKLYDSTSKKDVIGWC